MSKSKTFLAALSLTFALIAAVVVPIALSPGAFGFHSWPQSAAVPPREHAVVLETPAPAEPVAARPAVRPAADASSTPRAASRPAAPLAPRRPAAAARPAAPTPRPLTATHPARPSPAPQAPRHAATQPSPAATSGRQQPHTHTSTAQPQHGTPIAAHDPVAARSEVSAAAAERSSVPVAPALRSADGDTRADACAGRGSRD